MVVFMGSNTMAVYRHTRGSADLHHLYMLPIYYGETDEDQDIGATYEFVISDFGVDITYENFED